MKRQEIIKKYGKKIAEKIFYIMRGQTVGINEDGSDDYYEQDVIDAHNEIKDKVKRTDFD